jgi:branched-chain amino acid transport system substrate-binding protein
MYYGGITDTGARTLWRELARRPAAKVLVGGEGIAVDPRFTEDIPAAAARRTFLTVSTLAPEAYPPAGQDVLRRLGTREPYALHGYEAMALALDVIDRGGPTREGALEALFATRGRDSVLGRYSIDRRGDTTQTRYGAYRIERGALVFDRVLG